MENRSHNKYASQLPEDFKEKVVTINRVAKVVKGGKRFHFTALVVIGNAAGIIGVGKGKASEVQAAIKKAVNKAKKSTVSVPLNGTTIPHEIVGEFKASKVIMRPAAPGTGVIAGGGVKSVLDLAGYKDVLTKSIGSNNPFNVVYATLDGLQRIRKPEEVAALLNAEPVKGDEI